MIVMEAFGRGLALEPFLTSVVMSGSALREAGDAELRRRWLAAIAAGEEIVSFAYEEPTARYYIACVECRASLQCDGWKIEGRKINVLQAASANAFLVSARLSGDVYDPEGVALFLVPADAPGVRVTPCTNFDGTRAGVLDLNGVSVNRLACVGTPEQGLAVVERAVGEAIAAVVSEAVGAMDKALWTTVGYLKTRQQFGAPIGRFQALQHRAAEMYVATEQARSMAIYAAMNARSEHQDERRRALSQAKIQIAKSARFVGQQSIQLHGGIGMTEECEISHLFRRLMMIERQFGDVDHHMSVLEDLETEEECVDVPS